ncbi:hypothetical protein F4780DRAFT_61052 [Xylariomycetidae sp. FL0641]|nr:hypothetical protein F4780DRAFT_61052 [Xylariomycetidae sp. FL0641]
MTHKHSHHSRESQRYHRHGRTKPKGADEEATHDQEVTGASEPGNSTPMSSSWSGPVLESEGGRFNYQARQVDGRWEYSLMGAHSGAPQDYSVPAQSFPYVSYAVARLAPPYVSDIQTDAFGLYQDQYRTSLSPTGDDYYANAAGKQGVEISTASAGKQGTRNRDGSSKHKKNGSGHHGRHRDKNATGRGHGHVDATEKVVQWLYEPSDDGL